MNKTIAGNGFPGNTINVTVSSLILNGP